MEMFLGRLSRCCASAATDVVWARTDSAGLKDRAPLERAEADEGVVFTLDKDFWQLALHRPIRIRRCGVILFRAFQSAGAVRW